MLTPWVIVFSLPCIFGFPRRIPIGGIFDGDEMIQKAFEFSIKAHNKYVRTLVDTKKIFLTPRLEVIDELDVFDASQKVCELLSNGVAGILGPQNKVIANYVESVCDAMDLPYIPISWDSEPRGGNIINLYPSSDVLSQAFHQMIRDLKWETYALIYDDVESLSRLRRLLQLQNATESEVTLYHIGDGPDFRDVLDDLKYSFETNILIGCSEKNLAEVLKQAQQVGIMLDRYNIIVTSLDFSSLDLEPYMYSGVNVTGFRLINPEDPIVTEVFGTYGADWNISSPSEITVEAALVYDAVQLFARGLAVLENSVKGNLKQLSCNSSDSWEYGYSLSNFIRAESIQGLSGLVKFDTLGFRSDFQLDIVSLNEGGLQKVGSWESAHGITWLPKIHLSGIDEVKPLQDVHFIVLISLTNPYGMYKESSETRIGNDRYEGFAIDIIDEMSKMLGFNYTLEVQEDNVYGSPQKSTGEWNGMIRKIMDSKADLAITDLTITAERESAVDFTTPFMNLGISILYRVPSQAPPSWSSFLLPLSSQVWTYLIGAYVFVTLILYFVGRMCPAEWDNPYPCITEPEQLENPYTVNDTPFFIIATLVNGASDFAPRGSSTRTIGTVWWCFCLIMSNTYTANLAAALSTKPTVWPFKEADELPYQDKVKYGAKVGGSTLSFFKNATHEPYQLMYQYMMAHAKEVLTSNNEDGLRKVQQEDYAFFMESSSIEYFTHRHCNVTQVGSLLDAKGYGIAMRKGVFYRDDLSGAILKLKESGIMNKLQDKWWKEKRGGDKCSEEPPTTAEALNFQDVGGVFLVLSIGVLIAWIGTILSLLWHVRGVAIQEKTSFKEEIMNEWRFLMTCKGVKTVRRRNRSRETTTEDNKTQSS